MIIQADTGNDWTMKLLLKVIGTASIVGGLICAAFSAVNLIHFDSTGFSRGVESVITRSGAVREAAGPHYQREILMSIPSRSSQDPVFRLDDLLDSAVVVDEPDARGQDVQEILFALEFSGESGLTPSRDEIGTDLVDGILRIRGITRNDQLRTTELMDVPREDVGEIVIRMKSTNGHNLQLGWSRDPNFEGKQWKNRTRIPIIADDEFHTYSINARKMLRRGLEQGDRIQALSFFPTDAEEDEVEIDFIRLVSRRSRYLGQSRGVTNETIGTETRQALFMLPSQSVEYPIRIPDHEPTLDLGMGLMGFDSGIEFTVRILEGDDSTILHRQQVKDANEWQDLTCDLSRWAGQDVRIRLEVDGPPGSVALWSNPTIAPRLEHPLRFIVILEDALRADHLSIYGYERKTSPFKEELMAQHGVLFSHAVSQATMTRPSVPSMMTSLMPTATGVWDFKDMLDPAYVTLAEVLRKSGFATASFVQNGNAGPWAGLHQGFDVAFDREVTGANPEDLLQSDLLWRWIQRYRHRDSFLYLHLADPHGPYDPPEPYREWFTTPDTEAGASPVEPNSTDPDWVERPTKSGRIALYDGEIRHSDGELRKFFSRLEEHELFEDTAFFLVSDHGEHFGDHGVWKHRPPGTRPAIGIPLMVVYPKRFKGGQRFDETVQLLDVMPTVLEIAQVEPDGLVLQGDSLIGLIEARDPAYWQNRVVVSEEPTGLNRAELDRNRGIRVQGSFFYHQWHLISSRAFQDEARPKVPELALMRIYRINSDPAERSPLARFWPDLLVRYRYAHGMNSLLDTNLDTWRRFTVSDESRDLSFDPDVLDQLRSLGYLE